MKKLYGERRKLYSRAAQVRLPFQGREALGDYARFEEEVQDQLVEVVKKK